MKANESKSIHISNIHFTKRNVSPPVYINGVPLPQEEDVKYLGLERGPLNLLSSIEELLERKVAATV
jgi:hypothetical protein